MKISSDNWLLTAGYILSFVLGALVMLAFTDPELTSISEGIELNDWLSFVGAVLGAAITVYGALFAARLQLEKQERAEHLRNERELNAARSILASDLSDIVRYLEDSTANIVAMTAHLVEQGLPPNIEQPKLSSDIPLRLAKLVSVAPIDVSKEIVELLRELQIQRSRLHGEIQYFIFPNRGRRGLIRGPHNLDAALESTVSLYIQVNNLFEYARRETEHVNAAQYTRETIGSIVFSLDLERLADPEMLGRLYMTFGIHD
ncbi:MAG: hypothetical protein ACK4GK_16100 [Ferrovibrio sp.]